MRWRRGCPLDDQLNCLYVRGQLTTTKTFKIHGREEDDDTDVPRIDQASQLEINMHGNVIIQLATRICSHMQLENLYATLASTCTHVCIYLIICQQAGLYITTMP